MDNKELANAVISARRLDMGDYFSVHLHDWERIETLATEAIHSLQSQEADHETIAQAHMAGQAEAGIEDPSYSNAQRYAERVSPASVQQEPAQSCDPKELENSITCVSNHGRLTGPTTFGAICSCDSLPSLCPFHTAQLSREAEPVQSDHCEHGRELTQICDSCDIEAEDEQQIKAQEAEPVEFEDYDSGLLNPFGGGDVNWWQDYIRAEVARANDFWRDRVDTQPSKAQTMADHGPLPVSIDTLCEHCNNGFRVPLHRAGNTSWDLLCNFHNCPHCDKRNHLWIHIKDERALSAAPAKAQIPSDNELPGMWEAADFTGGATDCEPAKAQIPENWELEKFDSGGIQLSKSGRGGGVAVFHPGQSAGESVVYSFLQAMLAAPKPTEGA